jgi:predicted DNA-binding transcriptional regulator YafY
MNVRIRQNAVVRILRRSGTATVNDLVCELKTSRRTILRDVVALRDQGYVIHSECGRGGGLQLDPQSTQSSARISVAEVFALIISVTAMRAAKSLPFSDLADSGLAKIEGALPGERVRDLRRLLDCLYVGQLSPLQDVSAIGLIDPELLPAFETAFLEQRRLQISYCDAKGAKTCREVEPQAMLILPPLWYLVAWDPNRNDFRHFRMDRISSPRIKEGSSFRRKRVPFEDDVCPYKNLPS